MQIDRQGIREIRAELETLLKEFAEKHNVTVNVGNASFMPGQNVTFKVEFANTVANGEIALTASAIAFTRNATMYGLQPTDLNRQFICRNTRYTICGLAPKSWKNPILASRDDGAVFKFPSTTVANALRLAHPAVLAQPKPTTPADEGRNLVQIGAADVGNLKDIFVNGVPK